MPRSPVPERGPGFGLRAAQGGGDAGATYSVQPASSTSAVSGGTTSAPCPNRNSDRLYLALKEVIDARVWGGILPHRGRPGAVLTKKLARYLEKHYFPPTD